MIKGIFKEASAVLADFSTDDNFGRIEESALLIARSIKQGGKVITCGNGGSMSDAMHFAEELTGKFRDDRKSIPAVAISDPSYITCVANDYGYDQIFSRFVEGHGIKGDILLAISTSGNSENVVLACRKAREKGIIVIALTGKDGGLIKNLSDIEVRVPHTGYADRIQEIHIKVIHSILQYLEHLI